MDTWRAGGSSTFSSWVLEMERMLDERTRPSSVEQQKHWKPHSIYRVPEYIKNMTNRSAYRPWLVSLGPFHHGDPDLLPMEEHKRRAVLHLVRRSGKTLGEFVAAIELVAHELLVAYDKLDRRWQDNIDEFVKMMIMDGCFLLEIFRAIRLLSQGQVTKDYAPNDPVFGERGFSLLYLGIRSDMIVMENQVPLLVLERIQAVFSDTSKSAQGMVLLFLGRSDKLHINRHPGLHPLEILHRSFCNGDQESDMPSSVDVMEEDEKNRLRVRGHNEVLRRSFCKGDQDSDMSWWSVDVMEEDETNRHSRSHNEGPGWELDMPSSVDIVAEDEINIQSFSGTHVEREISGAWEITMPSAVHLSEAGIHFKKSKTDRPVVSFKNGVLSMPEIVVRDSTEKEFLNMMAFERLDGRAGSRATAFMIFMDNIIDSERDVALLKSKGIIKHFLSSDKEAAKLFNTLSKGALLSPYSHLHKVRQEVSAHCSKRGNNWRAIFVKTYLSNPWVFISLVAAVILLVATVMQTVYTVVPFYTKS